MKIFSIDRESDKIQDIISFLGLKIKFISKKKVKLLRKKYEDKNNLCLELKEKNQQLTKEKEEISALNLDNEKKKKNWHRKYEKVSKNFVSYIKDTLIKYNRNADLIAWFSGIQDKKVIFENGGPELQLLYIMSLLQTNQNAQAEIELRKYIAKFDLSNIEYFLSIANLAVGLGYHNEAVEKSAIVYQAFKENEKNNTLKSLLEGKSIAVVGNSPCQLGKGLGAEIDNHDVVIRMNNYQTAGFEKDYGSKTTIYARGGATDVAMRDFSEYKAIIFTLDFNNFEISDQSNIVDFCYNFHKENNNIISMNHEMDDLLKSEFPSWATTGLGVVWMIYKTLGNLDKVDFYGFNFLKDIPDDYSTHYFNDRDENYARKRSVMHNLIDEAVFMKDFIRKVKGL